MSQVHARVYRARMTDPIGAPDGRQVGFQVLATGTSGRTVLLCHPASDRAGVDPDPTVTATRNLTLLSLDSPTDTRDLDAAADSIASALAEAANPPVGVVGWSGGGRVALALAARHPALVDRLVLAGTPRPDGDDSEQAWGFALTAITAKTLVLAGSADPVAGPRHGTWFQRTLPNARYEQVPGADQHLIVPMWARVLSHLAPRTTR